MAKENQTRFRIVKKTNKEVTIKIGPETHTLPWEEYDKTFVTIDKFWAVLNEEEQKKQDLINEKINDATVAFMMARASESKGEPDLVHMGIFGHLLGEIQELSGMSVVQVSMCIRKRLMLMNPFMTNPMFPVSNSQKKLRRKIEQEADSEMNLKPTPVFEEPKPTLGDAFSCLGELKKKMDEENK